MKNSPIRIIQGGMSGTTVLYDLYSGFKSKYFD